MTKGLETWLGGRSLAALETEFDQQGYVIFEKVLSAEEVGAYRDALQPFLDLNLQGRNDFEGLKSNRVYGLLAKDTLFAEMITHPLALHFAERDLGQSCLLSAALAINLHPGETVQPWHMDDGHIDLPLPRPSAGVSAFWTLDDTTEQNGATEVLPGSHKWDQAQMLSLHNIESYSDTKLRGIDDDPYARADAVKAVMPAGSLMVSKGTLMHRGGSNRTDKPRMIVTPQYCAGWARPLESQLLAVPKDMAAAYPKRVQELLGYSIHAPFMGYVDGMHPNKVLG